MHIRGGNGAVERGIPGVVDQERDIAGDAGRRSDLIGISHVEGQRHQTPIATLEQLGQRGGVASGDVDLGHTALEQFFDEGAADAAIGACHQGNGVCDFHCGFLLERVGTARGSVLLRRRWTHYPFPPERPVAVDFG
ncbi:hypothetical protein D3C87_1191550 [compost metagenome]